MEILYNADDRRIERKSSINQHKHKFSVYAQGGWLPVSYDVIESVGCEGIKSHKAILSLDEKDLGYIYPVATCTKYTNKYIFSDNQKTELRELPEWFGAGLYEAFVDEHVFTNADSGALGEANKIHYKVGLDYYRAKTILPASA